MGRCVNYFKGCQQLLITQFKILGGVRAAGLIWSPLISAHSRVSNQLFQIADWLPTLYSAAGGDLSTITTKLQARL